MDTKLFKAAKKFINQCGFVIASEDLRTKIRIHLKDNYFFEMFYNDTLKKYSYTLIKENKRILGWDNASHHKDLENYPHHFHGRDGKVYPSELKGNPIKDVEILIEFINKYFKEETTKRK